ncbi:homoserine kinase [Sediminihabitans luteus]|uniref:Homoserine kinase n=1 Tax=Sediminihabitans luteus TaxID=1138585 RepID=A0A2M9CDW7_9CELL|nr:homoserine kinase [Sediminihabitans luteus]PJJ70055.1 homoserine kinase [Sediminihabitans luteus]GIJ00161.1 homoserine kinase [Sediminihabitans luteus]
MRLGADHVRVRVPATSANLGPGFDALGLALALHDDVEVRAVASDDVVVTVEGEGAGEVPDDATHLVVRALVAGIERAGAPLTGFRVHCTNRIPHGRGLGSSAAAVVAGIAAARGLVADPSVLDDAATLRLATEFEGHPDNAAPAVLGGATIAWDGGPTPERVQGGVRAVGLPLHPGVEATVLVPTARLATSRARGVLPAQVPHADAARTAGRAALLVEALTRRPDLLLDATQDALHQEYRSDVMPGSWDLLVELRDAGLAATVSGAGPTVLVLSESSQRERVDAVLASLVGGAAEWQVARPAIDTTGVRVRRVRGGSDEVAVRG